MSRIDVYLDKQKLLNLIQQQIALKQHEIYKFSRVHVGEPDRANLKYVNGWWFYKLDEPGRPAWWVGDIEMSELGVWCEWINDERVCYPQSSPASAIIWLGRLTPYYLMYYTLYLGAPSVYMTITLESNGSIRYIHQWEEIDEEIAPPGTVSAGDTLLIDYVLICMHWRLFIHKITMYKWIYDTDTPVKIVEYQHNYLAPPYHFGYVYILESRDSPCYYGVAYAGLTTPVVDTMKWLRKLGLPNPNEVKPW